MPDNKHSRGLPKRTGKRAKNGKNKRYEALKAGSAKRFVTNPTLSGRCTPVQSKLIKSYEGRVSPEQRRFVARVTNSDHSAKRLLDYYASA